MKNNQKGITLVALVVTIIVLLILAGVSLSLVAGSNGIMNRATRAVSEYDKGTAVEQAELEITTAISNYYEKRYVKRDGTVTVDQELDTMKETLPCGATLSYEADESDVGAGTFTLELSEVTATATLSDSGDGAYAIANGWTWDDGSVTK